MNDKLTKYLSLEVIWKDDDMFELKVIANNKLFYGITEVYDQTEPLLKFCNSLKGYPNGEKYVIHSAGIKDGYSYFEMIFYQIGLTGKIGIGIYIQENSANKKDDEIRNELKMQLVTEPALLDRFHDELVTLAKNENGKAELTCI